MLTQQHIQERLSLAYIYAISGMAGANISAEWIHDYGVDGEIIPVTHFGGRRIQSPYAMHFQAKATTKWSFEDTDVVYDLEAKTYNDFRTREPGGIPLFLILMCSPRQPTPWLTLDEASLQIFNCCYWYRVPPGPPTSAVSTKRIRIPRSNILTIEALKRLLVEVREEMRGSRA